jgi:hypothetical protein
MRIIIEISNGKSIRSEAYDKLTYMNYKPKVTKEEYKYKQTKMRYM